MAAPGFGTVVVDVAAVGQPQFAIRWGGKQAPDIAVAALSLELPRDPGSEERDTIGVADEVAAGVALGPELRRVSAQGQEGRQTDQRELQMPALVLPKEVPYS